MKVVFLGTDVFGELALRKVASSIHKVVLVVTQPDRPKGRGRKIVPGPVKVTADEFRIPVIQPESIRQDDARSAITSADPDIIAVVSYGEYIPSSIFNAPPCKSINVHPSLLPRWRGAAPIRYTLLAGDLKTGVTVQYIHKRMDAGDILARETVDIEPGDDHGSLCNRLYPLGADLLVQTIDDLEAGSVQSQPQDESAVTKASKIEKDDLWIDWSKTAEEVRNRIRAFSPKPGARARFRDSDYKIFAADPVLVELESIREPGIITDLSKNGPVVACLDKGLVITTLQPPGKKPMSGLDFQNGYRINVEEHFSGSMKAEGS